MKKENIYPIQIKRSIPLIVLNSIFYGIIIFSIIGYFIIPLIKADSNLLSIAKEPYQLIYFSIFLFLASFTFFLSMEFLYLKSIRYFIEEDNLILKGGVISRFERVLPYSKIQHVIVSQSLFERIFGLASLVISTAREGEINYRDKDIITGPTIPKLDIWDAKRLAEEIISISKTKYKTVAGV